MVPVTRRFTEIVIEDIPSEWGLFQYVVDHDREFDLSPVEPIIVNQLPLDTVIGRDYLNSLLFTQYDNTDRLPALPSCECNNPALQGEQHIGTVCPECNTPVCAPTERPLISNVWVEAPAGVTALINPIMWSVLAKTFTTSDVNILEWLILPSYQPKNDNIYALEVIRASGYRRGLNSFIENFDQLMELLLDGKTLNIKGADRTVLRHFIKMYRKVLFPKRLPIPNKVAFIMEKTPHLSYGDSKSVSAIDAVMSIASIYKPNISDTQQVRENRAAKAVIQLCEYYVTQLQSTIGTKTGWGRKHVVGSRQDWSARCVISSITEAHHYEDVKFPWGLSVALFQEHIANYLLKEHYTPDQIRERIHRAIMTFDPGIHDILTDIIRTSPGRGPAVLIQRNPTLSSKSAQLLTVVEVKTDPSDVTMGLSVLCLVAWNADFDGECIAVIGIWIIPVNVSNCWKPVKGYLTTTQL